MSVRLAAVAFLAMGCAAARSTYHLVEAEQQLDLAREAGSEELAPFEWIMAREHMTKAHEEWGYSQFETAEQLAGSSTEWAQKAIEQSKERSGAKVLEVVPDDVPDVLEAPVEAPDEPSYIPEDDLLDEDVLDELEPVEEETIIGPDEPWSDE